MRDRESGIAAAPFSSIQPISLIHRKTETKKQFERWHFEDTRPISLGTFQLFTNLYTYLSKMVCCRCQMMDWHRTTNGTVETRETSIRAYSRRAFDVFFVVAGHNSKWHFYEFCQEYSADDYFMCTYCILVCLVVLPTFDTSQHSLVSAMQTVWSFSNKNFFFAYFNIQLQCFSFVGISSLCVHFRRDSFCLGE